MLTLTENASTVVKTLASRGGTSEEAGLRISSAAPESREYAVEVAPQPADSDTVIEADGARVFLEPNAAISLDDKILDADVSEQGNVRFSIAEAAV
ncbi:Fe-S cluster assembly protein HesB [Gryllotalpicola protaetiae]|uniref:Fe-S cluster assembly protein HesB n=1 Tax=Gryllotalpicola protaetiae TaxID=2419771 RepID=A0A387BQU6_9MICO|nr:Fe-S cluster assembly protein HesB [Gryllotalpicola protaetiae]AYG05048.1 Fe-S cluster assembly protein HesB [Gryllotalpicola protaetiae]